jgi:hypothetical protein
MKYLKSFSSLKESNRFLNFKEVLNYVEDLSSDFTDEGFETLFGIMPGAIHHPDYANFDENLDDIQIKMASMGKSVIYFKLDLKNIKDQSFGGKLNNDKVNKILSMCKDTFIRFGSYGEPSLMPIYLVDSMSKVSKGWTGYTHQYAKDWAKEYKNYFMASIESATEKTEWRAFRVLVNNNYDSNAVQCPASVESGKTSNCAKCGLCSGLLGKGSKDVKILQH